MPLREERFPEGLDFLQHPFIGASGCSFSLFSITEVSASSSRWQCAICLWFTVHQRLKEEELARILGF